MSVFLVIVGWIVFLFVSFWSTFLGLVAKGKTAEETGSVVYWLLFFVVAIGSKILWIENIWLATGIWLVGGFILGIITAPLLRRKIWCADCHEELLKKIRSFQELTADFPSISQLKGGAIKCRTCGRYYCSKCRDSQKKCICGNQSWYEVKDYR